MLRDVDLHDLHKGQIVYLTPHTKQASRACHERRTVKIMHEKDTIKRHWPMIVVEWKQDGVDKWERVHRDNVKLRAHAPRATKVERAEGDGAQSSGMGRWASKVRVMPGKIKPIELAEGQEQGTLF